MRRNKNGRRGNAVVEFGLAASLMIPLLIGSTGVGLTLNRSMQVAQVTRDTTKMFFTGVDFSDANNQKLVGRLASGMGLASNSSGTINPSGNGVVILTRVVKVGATECILGGYSNGVCPNKDQLVVTRRLVIGNSSLITSRFGSPNAALIGAGGNIVATDYADEASVVVPSTTPAGSLGLAAGQYTYVGESFFQAPQWSGFFTNRAYAFNMM
jgi:Flp pilus assembly protein TadG